jgi:hypothetical protein
MLKQGKISLFDDYKKIKEMFIKIRKQAGIDNDLFQKKDQCVWLQKNSDGSSSYIIKKQDFHKYELPGILEDKREVLISEIFSYINSSDRA